MNTFDYAALKVLISDACEGPHVGEHRFAAEEFLAPSGHAVAATGLWERVATPDE